MYGTVRYKQVSQNNKWTLNKQKTKKKDITQQATESNAI